MSRLRLLSLSTVSLAAGACTGDLPPSDAGPASIKVSTVRAPVAIAFRDGVDGEWQTPAPTATGSYELEVNGPYVVSVVCSAGDDFIIATRQLARTPDDERDLDMECTELPLSDSTVTGKMVQPGEVSIGGALGSSTTPDWPLDFILPPGTYDLISTSRDRIAIRRDLAVSGSVDVGTIDLAQQGTPLVPVALTTADKGVAESIYAEVVLSTPRSDSGYVYGGSPATARVAPGELLSTDVKQLVTMVGWDGDQSRSVRRAFHPGDPTAFTLPPGLPPVQFLAASGKINAAWSALPEHDKVHLRVVGSLPALPPAGGTVSRTLELELSQRFLAATGATEATLDTDLPGYQAGWRPDLAREYLRELTIERERDGERTLSSTSKLVNAQSGSEAARHRALPRSALAKSRRAR